MAKHVVVMLVGVTVEADDKADAIRRANIPFRTGLLPNLVGLSTVGHRLAEEDDLNGGMQRRIDAQE